MMQWLVNEWKDFQQKIDQRIEGWARSQVEAAEKIQKLEGEIRAMKARMGKKNAERE